MTSMNVSSPKRLPCLNSSSVLANRLFCPCNVLFCRKGGRFCLVKRSLPPANEVAGRLCFLHLSVILFTGGGGSVRGSLFRGRSFRGVSVQVDLCLGKGGLCPWGSLSMRISVQEGLCPGGGSVSREGVYVHGCLCLWRSLSTLRMLKSGRYASYSDQTIALDKGQIPRHIPITMLETHSIVLQFSLPRLSSLNRS